jgi:hypothetical protein
MSSIASAMTQDFLNRGRWVFLLAMLGVMALPFLIFGLNELDRTGPPSHDLRVHMGFVTVLLEMLGFGVAIYTAHGTPHRLYPLPATTWSLVVWRLAPSMIAVAAMHVAVTSILNAFFDLQWPLWGPALFLAAAAACMQGALWVAGPTQLGQVVAMSGLGAALGIWIKTRFGRFTAPPEHVWAELTAAETLTMALAAVGGFIMAYEGAMRERRGDAWTGLRFIEWLDRLRGIRGANRMNSVRSAQHAQFSYEWLQKGSLLPAVMIIVPLFAAVFCLAGPPQLSLADLPHLALGCGWLLPLGGLIAGFIFGRCSRAADNRMGSFQASRPVTNTVLANAVLKSMVRSVLVTFGIWLAILATTLILAWLSLGMEESARRLANFGQWKELTIASLSFPAAAWIASSAACCVCLTGRPLFIVGTFGGTLGTFIGTMMAMQVCLTPEQRVAFTNFLLYGMALAFAGGTIFAYIMARSKRLVSALEPWIALAVWGVLALVQLFPVRHYLDMQNGAMHAFFVGLFALAVAPFAAAPLAIGWNRHR